MKLKGLSQIVQISILPGLAVYSGILFISAKLGIEPGLVLRDLMQTCNYPIGVGMISNIGILLWAFAGSICLFSSFSGMITTQKMSKLILLGGILSALLCLDDLFLLHDRHISQTLLYSTYALLSFYIFFKFKNLIQTIDTLAILIALVLLGLSVFSDIFQWLLPIGYENVQFFEEGFKFIGIICWLNFWWKACIVGLKSANNH